MNSELTAIASKISVVIPVYNKEKYLVRCVQSVLNQTVKPYKIITIDDGSTDNSLKILQDNYVHKITIVTQVNSGVSVARNAGVDISTTAFVAFLDADDEWTPRYLENICRLIQDYPKCSVYATAYQLTSEKTKFKAKYKGLPPGYRGSNVNYFEASLHEWSLLSSSSTVVLKSLFNKVGGFNPELRIGEDLDLWSKFALNGRIAFLNEPHVLYHYFNDSSVTSSNMPGEELTYIKHLSYLLDTNQIAETLQTSVRRFIGKGLQHLVREQAKQKKYKTLLLNFKNRRLYGYFGFSTIKMLVAILVPTTFYNFLKRLTRK